MSDASDKQASPWLAGWRAARANFVPACVVQGLMIGTVLAYFLHEPTREIILRVAALKQNWGYGYSMLAGVVAGALAPEWMRVLFMQHGRARRKNLTHLAFTVPFWGFTGFLVDTLYRFQAQWFGDEPVLSSIVPQVLVDQFLYCPLVAMPLTVAFYEWKNHGCRWPHGFFTWRSYQRKVLPVLITNWALWLPLVSVIYALPEPVRVPVFSLALTLWVIIYTWMSEEGRDH